MPYLSSSIPTLSQANRMQRAIEQMTLQEQVHRYINVNSLIAHMDRQLEKWRLERALLLTAVREADPSTPGYQEMVEILLEAFSE